MCAEGVAGEGQNDQSALGVLLVERDKLLVVPIGCASFAGHIHDQHGFAFELLERHHILRTQLRGRESEKVTADSA